jgi:hypothetical protein
MKLAPPKTRRIKLAPPKSRRVSPEFVAKALGAELIERCFKYGCRHWAVTWEKHDDEPPAALCAEHASRPERPGTAEQPTPILSRS